MLHLLAGPFWCPRLQVYWDVLRQRFTGTQAFLVIQSQQSKVQMWQDLVSLVWCRELNFVKCVKCHAQVAVSRLPRPLSGCSPRASAAASFDRSDPRIPELPRVKTAPARLAAGKHGCAPWLRHMPRLKIEMMKEATRESEAVARAIFEMQKIAKACCTDENPTLSNEYDLL